MQEQLKTIDLQQCHWFFSEEVAAIPMAINYFNLVFKEISTYNFSIHHFVLVYISFLGKLQYVF